MQVDTEWFHPMNRSMRVLGLIHRRATAQVAYTRMQTLAVKGPALRKELP